MRRVVVGLVLVLVGAVVNGCASSTHVGTVARTGTVATAAATKAATTRVAGPPTPKQMGRAEAKVFARAVNLRQTDVPDFKISAEEHETATEKRHGLAFARCVGPAALKHALSEADSQTFERQSVSSTESVSSYVEVASSSTVATEVLEAVQSERSRACLSGVADQLFGSQGQREGITYGPVSVGLLRPPAAGTAGSFGWRINTTLSIHGIRVPVQMDMLGFRYRAAIVLLLDVGFPQPPTGSLERRLFSLLIRRARAYPG
jgi:hypothetical protein